MQDNIISNEKTTELNYQVDNNHESPFDVAAEFLSSLGYKTDKDNQGSPDIIIGSKNFTEQFILANIMVILIENYRDSSVEKELGLGGTKICFSALSENEIQIYPEYTGTGLQAILETSPDLVEQMKHDKDRVYEYVKNQFIDLYNITWMQPFGFYNSYALMMRKDISNELGIDSISELAEYIKKSQ